MEITKVELIKLLNRACEVGKAGKFISDIEENNTGTSDNRIYFITQKEQPKSGTQI
jgi:hypothetical protein